MLKGAAAGECNGAVRSYGGSWRQGREDNHKVGITGKAKTVIEVQRDLDRDIAVCIAAESAIAFRNCSDVLSERCVDRDSCDRRERSYDNICPEAVQPETEL